MTPLPASPLHKRLRTIRRAYGAAAAFAALVAAGAAAMRGGMTLSLAGAAAGLTALAAGALHARILRKKTGSVNPDAEFRRGVQLLLANDRFGAESAFRDLAARNTRDVEATLYLGLVLREHGDARGAARMLKRALRLDLGRKWGREILELLEPLR